MSQHIPKLSVEDAGQGLGNSRIGIVKALWNKHLTGRLAEACRERLLEAGIAEEYILTADVPGSFELPLGAQYMFEQGNCAAVVCIGCLIRGETDHYHFIADAVSKALAQLQLSYGKPVVFGVLTVEDEAQAEDRIDGGHGNKGREAAEAAIHMLRLKEDIRTQAQGSKRIGFMNK